MSAARSAAAESWGLGTAPPSGTAPLGLGPARPYWPKDQWRADGFFVNAAVFIGVSVLLMLVVCVYLVYEVQTLKHPEHMPNANLLYVSLLEIPHAGTLVLKGIGTSNGGGIGSAFDVDAGAGAGADVPEAALVLGARCHCCDTGKASGGGGYTGPRTGTATDADTGPRTSAVRNSTCALVACRLEHDQVILETPPDKATTRCYALLDHAAAWAHTAHWLRNTVDALARERHVP